MLENTGNNSPTEDCCRLMKRLILIATENGLFSVPWMPGQVLPKKLLRSRWKGQVLKQAGRQLPEGSPKAALREAWHSRVTSLRAGEGKREAEV